MVTAPSLDKLRRYETNTDRAALAESVLLRKVIQEDNFCFQVPSYAAAKGGILTASNNSSQQGDIMALNEVMKCSQCMILITSKLHFVLHIKEVHGGKT